jgi:hypothetical protein
MLALPLPGGTVPSRPVPLAPLLPVLPLLPLLPLAPVAPLDALPTEPVLLSPRRLLQADSPSASVSNPVKTTVGYMFIMIYSL